MARSFHNLPYGPCRLRPLLRSALRPGERVIAWGSAQEANALTDLVMSMLRWCTIVLPGAWGFVGLAVPIALQVRTWGVVLTDRRLLLLSDRKEQLGSATHGIVAEYPLDALDVDTVRTLAARPAFGPRRVREDAAIPPEEAGPASDTLFRLSPPAEPPFWVRVPGGDGEEGGPARLREALALLAGEPRPTSLAASGA